MLVRDLFGRNGCWNLEGLSFTLPKNILGCINGTSRQELTEEQDCLFWKYSLSGQPCSKSAYLLAADLVLKFTYLSSNNVHHNLNLSWIWKLRAPSKIKHFLWLAALDRLVSRSTLFKRNLISDMLCPLCLAEVENSEHILGNCHVAQSLWTSIDPSLNSNPLTFLDWLKVGSCNNLPSKFLDISCGLIFVFGCWTLWN